MVTISYVISDDVENIRFNGKYHVKDMRNVYGNIFTAEFVLFYGQGIQYFITEESEDGVMTTEIQKLEGCISHSEIPADRYEAINDMSACMQLKDSETLEQLIESYGIKDIIISQIFKPKY